MDKDLREKIEEYIWTLYNEPVSDMSYKEIGFHADKVFGIDYFDDSERVRNIIRRKRNEKKDRDLEKVIEKLNEDDKFTQHKQFYNKEKNKVLFFGDLHIPFQRDDALDIIDYHKDEIRALVLAGDIIDCFEISVYPQIFHLPITEELVALHKFVKQVRDILPDDCKIIMFPGNHEDRMLRFIARMHQKELMQFLNPRILEMIKDGFSLYKNGDKQYYPPIENIELINSWYININNEIIACHPKNFSRVHGKNAKNAIEHFISRGEIFSTVVVAHTHRQAEVGTYLGKHGIESGCMCKHMDYAEGRTTYAPQDAGYVLVTFNQDNTINKNKSKIYNLDLEHDINENSQVIV